jgi:hypothetical protein
VALTILAIALVSLFRSYSSGVRAASASSDYEQARILAQSLLTESVEGIQTALPVREGAFGRFNWRVQIDPVNEGWATARGRKYNWQMANIAVSIAWGKGRTLKLQTLKIAGIPRE